MFICKIRHESMSLPMDRNSIQSRAAYATSPKVPFLSADKLVASFLDSSSNLSLKWSLRNSTAIKVRAEAGMYHVILGMLPLNIPFVPSLPHIVLTASNQLLYLRILRESTVYKHHLEPLSRSIKPMTLDVK